MDKKEVNSSNFTFKNLYKPLEVCARRYEIVSRLVDHFKNDLGKKQKTHAHYHNIDLNQMSHRYVSGVLQNEPSTSAHLIDRCENVDFS